MLPKSNSFAIFVSVISSIFLSSLVLFFITSCGSNNPPLPGAKSNNNITKVGGGLLQQSAILKNTPTIVETGVMAASLPPLPASQSILGLNALSSNVSGSLYRYPAEEPRWFLMTNNTAYIRDVVARVDTYIYGATDGETWTAIATVPDGNNTTVSWPTATFYSTYQGKANCFVTPYWMQCGSNNILFNWNVGVQCKPPGVWKIDFYNNNKYLFSKQFTVLPQIEPARITAYSQNAYTTTPYDSICKGTDKNGNEISVPCDATHTIKYTIQEKGCALTDAAMILRYHGITTDPDLLNTWLTNNGGYDSDGLVKLRSIVEYAQKQGVSIRYPALTPDPLQVWQKLSTAEQYICFAGPQEMGIRYNAANGNYGHWIIATGKDATRTNYLTIDPLGGVIGTVAQAGALETFSGPEHIYSDRSGLTFAFHSPGDLLVTDPLGRKVGYDPITKITYKDIPESSYKYVAIDNDVTGALGEISKILDIPQPVVGNYQLQVIGTGSGTYTLDIDAYDTALTSHFIKTLWNIDISPGVIHTYNFFFPKTTATLEFTAASTSFDGGGQRPVDVNKFLSYVYPAQTTTTLPAGTSQTSVVVIYDKAIIPATFTATLNGVNVTNLFKPTAGGIESVSLNLNPASRNTLVLSVDGNLPGRVATDTDRLVFIVP